MRFIYVRCYIDPTDQQPPAFIHKFIEAEDEEDAYTEGLCQSPELDEAAKQDGFYEARSMNDYAVEIPWSPIQ